MSPIMRAALTMVPRHRPSTLPADAAHATVNVDRERLQSYQEVCGFPRSDQLPVTYPHVLGFGLQMGLITRRDFPLPAVGLVHVNNRITQVRPLTADDVLDLTVHAEHLRSHPRGRQFEVVTVAVVDGVEVWRDVSTYLRREKTPHVTSARPDSRGLRRDPAHPASSSIDAADTGPTGIDPIGAGSTGAGSTGAGAEAWPVAQAVWRVTPDVGTSYAAVSGDHNPIHTSWVGARLFGFPRPIAHGMWTKARCLAALAGRLPDSYTVEVAFKAPVLLPANVEFTASQAGFTLRSPRDARPHLVATLTPSP